MTRRHYHKNAHIGEGNGVEFPSSSEFAPSAKIVNDSEGAVYPFSLKLYNQASEIEVFRVYAQQSSPTDNLQAIDATIEFPVEVRIPNMERFSGKAYRYDYDPQDVDGTVPAQGGVQFVGVGGWALPAPTRGARLLVCGSDDISAPVTNTISFANAGCVVTGISHNGVAFSESVSLDVRGRCIELVGINTTTWRIVGTAPWTR